MRQAVEQDPPAPRSLKTGVDPVLEMIALKCLQKPPELRYRSADDLADDLEAWLSDESPLVVTMNWRNLVSRIARETSHAEILQNWGLIWMLHGSLLFALAVVCNLMQSCGVESRLACWGVWGGVCPVWIFLYWRLRKRAGPVTLVERQLAHHAAAATLACGLAFVLEGVFGLPLFSLSPVFALVGAYLFLMKAAMMSGRFYLQAVAYALCAPAMYLLPEISMLLLGLVSLAAFFVPGWRYYRRRRG